MTKCVSCSSSALSESHPYLYKSEYFLEHFPNLVVLKCDDCNLLQVDHGLLSNEALTEYYRSYYRKKANIATLNSSNNLLRASGNNLLSARGNALASLAGDFSDQSNIKKIFELGSGHGYNLRAFKELFPEAQLFTDELDENAWSVGKMASITEGPYDIVIMSHVLEHLINPHEFVKQVCQNLRASGLLIVEVPYESKNFVFQFSSEGRYHEPHITFFSKQNLEKFFMENYSELLNVKFSGSAGVIVGERDKMITDTLNPPLKDIMYQKLAFSPTLQRGMRTLYRRIKGKTVVDTDREFDFTNNSLDDSKVFLRIILQRL